MSIVQAKPGGSGGTETRSQLLPTVSLKESEFQLPNYDYAEEIRRPAEVGVKRGDGISDVVDAARGVAYYTDVIGFGQPSNFLTQGMPMNPLGINYFMPTGMTCSNGANMWQYVQGIPDGSAFGKTIQKAVAELGGAQLRGLAPGIVEDTKAGLNPMPIFQAAFGNVYPECELVTKPVGDAEGMIRSRNAGPNDPPWIQGAVQEQGGRPTQTRWIQKTRQGNPVYLTKAQWDAAPKTHNSDGTPKATAGFSDMSRTGIVTVIVLGALAFAFHSSRK